MNPLRFFQKPLICSLAASAITAALDASSGTEGARLLGYSHDIAVEMMKMGAIGGAIVGGASGLIGGLLHQAGVKHIDMKWLYLGGLLFSASAALRGLVGFEILNQASESMRDAGETAASFAVGGAVIILPISCVLLVMAHFFRAISQEDESTLNHQVAAV